MSLDPKIKDAIKQSATEAGQDADFANKLIAWVDDLCSGNARLDDTDSVRRHMSLLYETTKTTS